MTNEQIVWEYLIAQGMTEAGAAGCLGNIFAESGISPTNLQNTYNTSLGMTDDEYTAAVDAGTYANFSSDSAGYGLVQWTYSTRKAGLLSYVKSAGTSIGDLTSQLGYLMIELKVSYATLLATLKSSDSYDTCARDFMTDFERPADQSETAQAKRVAYAKTYYDKYAESEVSTEVSTTTTTEDIDIADYEYEYDYQPCESGKYWYLGDITITGIVLHSIGCPQPSAQVMANAFNKSTVSASVHGFIEPGKYIETAPTRETVGKAKKCYHVGGDWNSSRIGLEMCEPSNITYVSGATWTSTDQAAALEWFSNCTVTAAYVIADLCIFHGLDVSAISTHAEAYQLGKGSNHGDPAHIWDVMGYTIEDFRADVQDIINLKNGDFLATMTELELQAYIAAQLPTSYYLVDDVPSYYKEAVQHCIDNGYLNGKGVDENGKIIIDLTEDVVRLLVINYRAGLYAAKETAEAAEPAETATAEVAAASAT